MIFIHDARPRIRTMKGSVVFLGPALIYHRTSLSVLRLHWEP